MSIENSPYQDYVNGVGRRILVVVAIVGAIWYVFF